MFFHEKKGAVHPTYGGKPKYPSLKVQLAVHQTIILCLLDLHWCSTMFTRCTIAAESRIRKRRSWLPIDCWFHITNFAGVSIHHGLSYQCTKQLSLIHHIVLHILVGFSSPRALNIDQPGQPSTGPLWLPGWNLPSHGPWLQPLPLKR